MCYPLPADCVEWQEKIRAFVDEELIPWEVEAELNDGVIPEDASERHWHIADDMSLNRMDICGHEGTGWWRRGCPPYIECHCGV